MTRTGERRKQKRRAERREEWRGEQEGSREERREEEWRGTTHPLLVEELADAAVGLVEQLGKEELDNPSRLQMQQGSRSVNARVSAKL